MSGRRLAAVLGIALPFLAGAALRLWNLRSQVLGGDETHALRAAVSFPLPKILVTYQQTDNCIPLTALYKVLMDWGIPGTEMLFRLPILLCGLAALLALPAAFAGRVSGGTVLVYRWLVALSPALVLYSRIARSYMPMVLLTFGAVMAFEAWWRTRSLRAGAIYVVLGALAVWFHLGAGPVVAAPFLFTVGDLAVRRKDVAKGLRDLILLGLALLGAFALFLLPALESLLAIIAGKRSERAVPWSEVVPGLLRLQAGTASAWVAVLFWMATLAGFFLLLRNNRRLALFTATVAAGHVAGILLLSPMGLASPLIFGRYLLPVLPFVLLWTASAFSAPETPVRASLRWGATAVLFLLILFAAGPFTDPRVLRTSFLHHNDFVAFYRPLRELPERAVPDFYRQIRGEAVVEFPWVIVWDSNHTFPLYQQVHGGRVLVSTPQRLLFKPPLALKNTVAPDPAAFCRSGARYLVVHLNIAREEDQVAPGGRITAFELSQPLRRAFRTGASNLAKRSALQWGKPVYGDRRLRVWDLQAVCSRPPR